jgi:hypothetical protein
VFVRAWLVQKLPLALWALVLEHLVARLLGHRRATYSRLVSEASLAEPWVEPLVAALGLVASVESGKQPAGWERFLLELLPRRLSRLLVFQKTCVPVACLTRSA